MPTKLKPYNPSRNDLKSYWHVVDANGQVLGRMATDIAVRLMGKHRPSYVPHMLSGDFVIVINADKVRVSGKKAEQKVYRRHSGYPGNLKEVTYSRMMARTPARVIEHAVRGMLPKNKLGNKAIRRLKVYAGPDHPHEAQVIGSERALKRLEAEIDVDEMDAMTHDKAVAALADGTQTADAPVTEPVSDADGEPADGAVDQLADDASSDEIAAADISAEVTSTDHAERSTKLSELGVSARVASALAAEGIDTVADVTDKTSDELLEIKGFGTRSLDEVRSALSDAGHKLE